MRTKANIALASAILLDVCATFVLARAPSDDAALDSPHASAALLAAGEGDARMVVVKGKDVTGHVIKRLGLPNQEYCWQQCLQEDRCTGARWGAIDGTTAGQCQLMDGELTFGDMHEIRTEDGKRIVVIASQKEGPPPKGNAGKV